MFSSLRRAAPRQTPATFRKQLRHGRKVRYEQLEPRTMMAVDAVMHWNSIALQAEADDKSGIFGSADAGGPTGASRALAIVHVAMFDAINSVMGRYEPYLVKVAGAQGANIDAAIGTAAHDTLASVFSKQTAVFDAALIDWLDQIPNGASETLGVALGRTVAKSILGARQNDGSGAMMDYELTDLPGHHQPDPLHPDQGFLSPDWGDVTPFGVSNINNFAIPATPALNSQAYADAYNEVFMLGGDGINTPTIRTAEQTEIGLFWAYDGTKGLGTPPRLYNQIARLIADQQGNSEYDNARLFALVNVAMADAGICCWDQKYVYDFWRPVIGIRNAGLDGNAQTVADPNWTPLGAPASNQSGTNFTPPFPAYASGHATFGAATFQTLARFYGTDNISFTFTSDELNGVTTDQDGIVRALSPRAFTSFSQAAEENGQSRIYLGIHWSFDKVSGIAAGNKLANSIFDRILQPLRRAMAAGSQNNVLLVCTQNLIATKLMQIGDGVKRQVVILQTKINLQNTVYTAASLQPLFGQPGKPGFGKVFKQVVLTVGQNGIVPLQTGFLQLAPGGLQTAL